MNYNKSNISIEKERKLSNTLNEIIQAYLKNNEIGWTKNFSFYKVLENINLNHKRFLIIILIITLLKNQLYYYIKILLQ